MWSQRIHYSTFPSESRQPATRHHAEHLHPRACAAHGNEIHVPGGRLRRLRLRGAGREAHLGRQFGKCVVDIPYAGSVYPLIFVRAVPDAAEYLCAAGDHHGGGVGQQEQWLPSHTEASGQAKWHAVRLLLAGICDEHVRIARGPGRSGDHGRGGECIWG